MATSRPRGGGSPAAIWFEDFHPTSERHEEEGAENLIIYLPGFEKEQIKITYVHSTRIIRVQGERSIGNNVWARFNEAYPVPQNCVVNKISGKLQNGVLTIAMPKRIMTPLIISPKVEPKPTEAPKTNSDLLRPSKNQQEPKPTEVPETGSDRLRPSKDQEDPQPTGPSLPPKPKPVTEISPKEDHKKEAAQKPKIKETPKVTSTTTTTATMQPKDDEKPALSEPRKTIASLDKESSKKRKELVIADAALDKKERRKEKVKEDKDSLLAKVKEMKDVSKRSVQDLALDLKEESQALVNAGVAVLVIVALGAYITYSMKSSGNTKN